MIKNAGGEMKENNIYSGILLSIWYLIKRTSIAIVSAFPAEKVYSRKNRKSKIYIRDIETPDNPEKHYHRPMSKPAVEKQTLLKDSKKQKGYRP
ncbi:MAG: hypothetical protein AMS23_06310 [Bacteroides sp. SM1_62]|nr:MAG: hypothetical protein AMS26_00740 [Bacteroides sp. SM23_62]KPL23687.1 MAG: hypothetical protein AMS23_06310 [Bacteroides sp. SM1_62]